MESLPTGEEQPISTVMTEEAVLIDPTLRSNSASN